LKEIAAELNIGLDALVFVDDNPFEISEVQTHAPQVTCLQAPGELSELPALLRTHAHLWDRLVITEDDRKRVERMQGELDRRSLAQELTEEDFLAQLGLKVFIYPPDKADLARVTQLINKTNQFNVATKRYAQEEVEAFISADNKRMYCMSVSDKFGEYGLVGLAMIVDNDGGWDIDNFLMSCRVLGRGVETTLLAKIASDASDSGAEAVKAAYLPTPKNGLVTDLFARHGFAPAGEIASGGNRWRLGLPSSLAKPGYVELIDRRPA
ncbi:MAG: methoxymalonyl-ACP biosynthesis protein FkbH, partial [Pseudomonadota bacterium]